MCAIAGWLDYKNNINQQKIQVNNMLDTMLRRGPDANGTYSQDNLWLLHSRLIVVDPDTGKQPMSMKTGNIDYTIVYNGELYNTIEIQNELKLKGYHFNGHSDTEVVLKAFVEWGESCLQKFNGIFAFAVWDNKHKKLFLARDRIGVKPLFFVKIPNGIIFASEIKTLLASEIIKPQIDESGLNEIFMIGPGRSSGQGIFKDIQELCPGECACISKDSFTVKRYWSLQAREFHDSEKIAIEKTRELLIDAITRQLVSDVPLCCFLSGGLDSSCICKIASDHYNKVNASTLHTYSVDYIDNSKYFKENKFQPNSDNQYIDMMVDVLGTKHHEIILDNESLAEHLINATEARDLPAMADIDTSMLLFCHEVKKHFTVVLSGECSDEIFGGYPWYHDEDILYDNTFPWSRTLDLRKQLIRPNLIKNPDEYVQAKYQDTIRKVDKLSTDTKKEARMREMFVLNFNWFMQTLLDRKDRMSMYNGLEIRVPFCDYRIVEYAYNMPWSIKSYGNREKGILREAMRGLLPDEIIFRKKSPYPKTFNPIYFEIISKKVKDILHDKNCITSQLLNHQTVMSLIETPDKITTPWYGQLMRAPQILAYIIQIDHWFKRYSVEII